MKRLAYLADIFEKLNVFNLKLQGKSTNIIQLRDNLIAFHSKLQNWRRKVMQGNIAMLENLFSVTKQDEELNELLKTSITQHLHSLETEFKRYFLNLKNKKLCLCEILSRVPWMSMVPTNCKINFTVFKMIRWLVIFFRKCHSVTLNSCG